MATANEGRRICFSASPKVSKFPAIKLSNKRRPVMVGGLGVKRAKRPVVGRIPNGATIEVASPSMFGYERNLTFILNKPDFTTAKRMSQAINFSLGKGTSEPIDAASILVNVPCLPGDKVRFISAL